MLLLLVLIGLIESILLGVYQQFSIAADGATCVKPINTQSYLALYTLYNSTRGYNWTWYNESQSIGYKWNFSNVASVEDGAARPCRDDWQGIYCRDDPKNPDICFVANLELGNYNLHGPLPNEMSNISGLEELELVENSLTGTLPSTLGLLTDMTYLVLETNQLTGTIPPELAGAPIVNFEIQYNQFTGSVPEEFYNLVDMETLILGFNKFTGTVSTSVGRFSKLTELFLSNNKFTGSLPSELGMMNKTQKLSVDSNKITGSIPSELGRLSDLTNLILDGNCLTGTIPTELGKLASVQYFDVDVNALSGTLPTELGLLTTITTFGVTLNKLTGPLPTQLGSLRLLNDLSVAQNSFTGTLPSEYGSLSRLLYLYLNNNLLTGTFPSCIMNMQILLELIFEGNLLTSSLPTEVSNLKTLLGFSVAVNYMTGTVVDSFAHTLYLLQFDVNFFTGPLTGLFSANAADKFPNLVEFIFTENGFTGSFPSSLFTLPKIHTIFGDSNCFSGKLTCPVLNDTAVDDGGTDFVDVNKDDVINHVPFDLRGSALSILDLNGMSSGMGCRNYIVDRSILPNSGYYPTSYITGTIPSCFWSLPNLTALFLVGNGFTGPIYTGSDEQNVQINKLKNLSFASNELTGTIPDFILQHNFTQLDLSSNRLVGHVHHTFFSVCSTTVQLDLSVNRLSGNLDIDKSCDFNSLASNVLGGNLFTFDMHMLPEDKQEEALSYYGSFTLDIAMMVASPILILAVVVHICIAICRIAGICMKLLMKSEWIRTLILWHTHWQLVMLPVDVMYYFNTSIIYGRILVIFVTSVVFVVLILYCLLKTLSSENEYATYVNQYSWVASAAYLHGSVPVIAIASILFGSLLSIGVGLAHVLHPRRQKNYLDSVMDTTSSTLGERTLSDFRNQHVTSIDSETYISRYGPQAHHASKSSSEGSSGRYFWKTFVVVLKLFALFAVNIGIVGLANWGYLIAVLNNNPQIQFIQIALSIFKLLWNAALIGNALRWIRDPASNQMQCNPLLLRYFVKLINFVLIPCFATALVAGNCFLKLFEQSPAPTVYSNRCDGLPDFYNGTVTCDGTIVNNFSEQSFTPPFIYSFQCSSSVIANYVPVLLYAFALSGLIIPGILTVYMLLTQSRSDKLMEESMVPDNTFVQRGSLWSDGFFNSIFFGLFESWMPQVLRPSIFAPGGPQQLRESYHPTDALMQSQSGCSSSDGAGAFGNANNVTVLFPLESLISTQLLNATLLFTFGLVFPYLGAIIVCAAVFELWVWLIAIGKFHCSDLRNSSVRSSQVSAGTGTGSGIGSEGNVREAPGNGSDVVGEGTGLVNSATSFSSLHSHGAVASLISYRNSFQQPSVNPFSPSKPSQQLLPRISGGESEEDGSASGGGGGGRMSRVSLSNGSNQQNMQQRASSVDVLVTMTVQSVQQLRLLDLVIVVVVVCAFWSAMFFDMIADVYGTNRGIIVMLCVMLPGPAVCIGVVASYFYAYDWYNDKSRAGAATSSNGLLKRLLGDHQSSEAHAQANGQGRVASGSISLKFTPHSNSGLGVPADDRFSINSNNPIIFALHNSDFSRASENDSNM